MAITNTMTTEGLALLQYLLVPGMTLSYTQILAGNGHNASPESATGLAGDRTVECNVTNPRVDSSGNFVITGALTNSDLSTAITITEIGVFAEVLNSAGSVEKGPVLLSYLDLSDAPDLVPAVSVVSVQRTYDIPYNFGSGSTATVIVQPDAWVSSSQVSDQGGTAGMIVKTGTDGKIHADITGDALTLGGHAASYYAVASHTHDTATTSKAGFMSASDKTTLNTISSRIDQSLKTTDSPTFVGMTVNGVIYGARFE